MILDTSVFVALLRKEPEAASFVQIMSSCEALRMSAGSWVELGAVLSNKGGDLVVPVLNELVERYDISIEPVDEEQARIGHDAYREFGKGHHRAKLNFGDCFSYALAIAMNEPLLFKGNDFIHTDVPRAI